MITAIPARIENYTINAVIKIFYNRLGESIMLGVKRDKSRFTLPRLAAAAASAFDVLQTQLLQTTESTATQHVRRPSLTWSKRRKCD